MYHGGYSDYEADTNLTSAIGGDTKRGVLRHAVQTSGVLHQGNQAKEALPNEENSTDVRVTTGERNQSYSNPSDRGTIAGTVRDTHGGMEPKGTIVSDGEATGEPKKKLTLGELKELEQLELRITELEGLVKAYDGMIAQGGSDYSAIETTIKEREQVVEELEMSTLRWIELEERK